MERNITRIGWVNMLMLAVSGAATVALAYYSRTRAGEVATLFFGFGFLMSVIAYFQMRLEERERLERMEYDELNRGGQSESLFSGADPEALPARHSREQFERFFVPGFTVILFLLQVGATYYIWKNLGKVLAGGLRYPAVAMSLFAVSGLILFLLGRYSGSIARLQKQRLLRPSASYVMLCAYLSFALAATLAAVQMGYPWLDLWVARAFAVLLGLIAIETLINLILEIYRPRTKGTPNRVVYESRVIGLLGQPEGLITTAAQALDYQFGFKVSETWFYRFLERAFAWLLLLQFLALALSTCVLFVSPGEKALLERFGRPLTSIEPLGPGLHFKLPWPLDIAYRYRTDEIQSFTVGIAEEGEEGGEDDGHGHSRNAPKDAHDGEVIVWTVGHYQDEFNMLVASRDQMSTPQASGATEQGVPVDLLSVSIPVQYQISDIYKWAYNHVDAGELLERIGTREVVKYLVSVDLFDIMGSGRAKAGADLKSRIQAAADELELGVKILMVGLEDIHPPVKVAPAFESIVATLQENEAKLRLSEGGAAASLGRASGEAAELIERARIYRDTKVMAAISQAQRFTNQVSGFRASPQLFAQRAYLDAFSAGLTNSRKFIIISTNASDVIEFDLSDKIKGGLFDEGALLPD